MISAFFHPDTVAALQKTAAQTGRTVTDLMRSTIMSDNLMPISSKQPTPETRVKFNINVAPVTLRKLDEKAEHAGISRAEALRRIAEQALDNNPGEHRRIGFALGKMLAKGATREWAVETVKTIDERLAEINYDKNSYDYNNLVGIREGVKDFWKGKKS